MRCTRCNGTGRIEIPNDEQKFNAEFDRLDKTASLNSGECRMEALKYAGYTSVQCPECSGTGKVNE